MADGLKEEKNRTLEDFIRARHAQLGCQATLLVERDLSARICEAGGSSKLD
jgi:hypothetical protein